MTLELHPRINYIGKEYVSVALPRTKIGSLERKGQPSHFIPVWYEEDGDVRGMTVLLRLATGHICGRPRCGVYGTVRGS